MIGWAIWYHGSAPSSPKMIHSALMGESLPVTKGSWDAVYSGIRDHIISKSICVCGATNILADNLLPNKAVRVTIQRILESNYSSCENDGSVFQNMELLNPQAMAPSPTQSAASKGQQLPVLPPEKEETPKMVETDKDGKAADGPQNQEKARTPKVPDISEATCGSLFFKEQANA